MKTRWTTTMCVALSLATVSAVAVAQTADERVVLEPGIVSAPPWLGVQLGRTDGGDGVEVTNVMRRSPAEGSGVKVGDRIVAVAKQEVSSLREVQRLIRTQRIGGSVVVTVLRDGKKRELSFALEPMPDPETIVERHLLGYPAPDFSFHYVGDDTESKLSALEGRPTVIDFWATWCGPCHETQRELAEVKRAYGDRINLIGVTSESRAKVQEHLLKYPAAYAMATDPGGAGHTAFGIASFPTIVILDADQRVAAVIFGARKRELVERKLANLVGHSPAR